MGGFAEIENNEVTILVNGAERAIPLTWKRLALLYTQAAARVNQSQNTRQEQIQATQALKRARARFQAAGAWFNFKTGCSW